MSAKVHEPLCHRATLNQATSPDQRRHRRYGMKFPCRVKARASGESPALPELAVETLDISGGGLFFLASAEWTIGKAIEFELDLPVDRHEAVSSVFLIGSSRPRRSPFCGTITSRAYILMTTNVPASLDGVGQLVIYL